MRKDSVIFIAGHRGLVGSAITRALQQRGFSNLLTRTHAELELANQLAVADFFARHKPDVVILAAAKVGGIYANNTYPADFIYQNLMIQTNVIHSAYKVGVNRLLFLGSSCIYPRNCPQPIKEEYLLTAPLEPTNEAYAIAKIAGIKMCESYNRQFGTQYLSVMPTNLYGPFDNFDLQNSHVLPALIRKAHEAKMRGDAKLTVWGSGTPRREFLYVDDMADACIFLLENDVPSGLFNVGYGEDIEIRGVAEMVKEVIGFNGELQFDASKPDGTPRKLMDSSKMSALGWKAKTNLRDGIKQTYNWYLESLRP